MLAAAARRGRLAAICAGLCLIALGPVAGWRVAMADRGRRPWTGHGRGPRSLLPLSVLGVAALIGFPVDELWHTTAGIDVTMWSPPHLIMILAASFSGLAAWLVLADAGVRPADGAWARGLHVVAAVLTLQGVSSVQGEFTFGVPQISLAAGFSLVMDDRHRHRPRQWPRGHAKRCDLHRDGRWPSKPWRP